jgi:hypothetical protein
MTTTTTMTTTIAGRSLLLAAMMMTLAGAATARADRADYKTLRATADRLAQSLDMPADKRASLETKLAQLLTDPRFEAKYSAMPIRGVFAYQMGEGGLLVKVKRGKGLLRLGTAGVDVPLTFKSLTVGAQVGGSSEWGFGLVLGLAPGAQIGGDYTGGTVAATFVDASTAMMELTSKNPLVPHKIYLVGSATGATANAGGGKLTIVVGH